jgi:hypothetical protein
VKSIATLIFKQSPFMLKNSKSNSCCWNTENFRFIDKRRTNHNKDYLTNAQASAQLSVQAQHKVKAQIEEILM